MKIAFPFNTFPGGFLVSLEKAFKNLGYITFQVKRYRPTIANKVIRRTKLEPLVNKAQIKKDIEFNRDFLTQILDFKPDIFVNYSGSGLFPSTVKQIKVNTNCIMICHIADNPCDPDPRRDQYFPMTLQYYDVFLNPEPVWDKLINNLCLKPKIIRFFGGYNPEVFFPVKTSSISDIELQELECDLSFTGGSYHKSAEGAYRSGILSQLTDYNLKIWGDEGWKYRFAFFPEIQKAYQGTRLTYDKLRKLYSVSKINLNMPSPQIFTSFQPRVFEIAATKGFQIIDHSDFLPTIFNDINVPTFKSISELKYKIDYFFKHQNQRERIVSQMYEVVFEKFTWENQIKLILDQL